METSVRELFERYERLFNKALNGEIDTDEIMPIYAPAFIAASPAGIMTGKNEEQLKQVMKHGYARYRAIGTKEMRIRDTRVSPIIDEHHCVAHVGWVGVCTRAKSNRNCGSISTFTILCRKLEEGPKIFGWVSGDEQALLQKH